MMHPRKSFIISTFLLATASPTALFADKYEDLFRDFIVIRDRTTACITKAQSYAEAGACAGKTTKECLDPSSDWPYPPPRDCVRENSVWEYHYKEEAFRKLQWAYQRDQEHLIDGSVFSDAFHAAMTAELSWSDFAYAQCSLENLPDADKSYEYRMSHPTFCLERLYAERIYYLRSQTDMMPRSEP